MKKVFFITYNVKRFIKMMNNLQQRAEGVPGMGLVYGEPGLGKTFAITWWAIQNNAVYLRCANNMSSRWLLEELVEELGEIPYTKFSDIFNQAVSQLIKQPRIIIVDEDDVELELKEVIEELILEELLVDILELLLQPLIVKIVSKGNNNFLFINYPPIFLQ